MLAQLLYLRSLLLLLALLLSVGAGLLAALESGWLPAQGALAARVESCHCQLQWQWPHRPHGKSPAGTLQLVWDCFGQQRIRGGLLLFQPASPAPRGWQLRWWSETKQIARRSPHPSSRKILSPLETAA